MNIIRARDLKADDHVLTCGPVSSYGLVSVARIANTQPAHRGADGAEWVDLALDPIPSGYRMSLLTLADAPILTVEAPA